MEDDVLTHTVAVVAAYVSRNALPAAELPGLLASVYDTLTAITQDNETDFDGQYFRKTKEGPRLPHEPAVPVAESVHRDYVVCLEDGKKFKSMRRHLAVLGMTPEEYRARWNLDPSYPMVCAAYSEKRSALAIANGLGRKRR